MYKLLADESGLAEREKACVVAGFVGSVEQWGEFDTAWKKVLKDSDVPVFHGVEFWSVWQVGLAHFGGLIWPTPWDVEG